MVNKTKKLTLSLIIFTLISTFLSVGIFAYYTDIGKWLDQQQTPAGDGFGQERNSEDFIEDGCGTGTMLDTVTGLCWNKNLNISGEKQWAIDTSYDEPIWNGNNYEWPSGRVDTDYPAFKVCNDLTTAGHDDWRMPQRAELLTLIDETGGSGTTCTTLSNLGFTNCQDSSYWSANERGSSTSNAFSINLGNSLSSSSGKGNSFYITCVRRTD